VAVAGGWRGAVGTGAPASPAAPDALLGASSQVITVVLTFQPNFTSPVVPPFSSWAL